MKFKEFFKKKEYQFNDLMNVMINHTRLYVRDNNIDIDPANIDNDSVDDIIIDGCIDYMNNHLIDKEIRLNGDSIRIIKKYNEISRYKSNGHFKRCVDQIIIFKSCKKTPVLEGGFVVSIFDENNTEYITNYGHVFKIQLKVKINRTITPLDPFGEEDWGDENNI